MTVLDMTRQHDADRTSFNVELSDSDQLAECDWPAVADCRDLKMLIFQSREFVDIWTSTIGKAGGIRSYLLTVRDDRGEPILYLPLIIETKFNIRFLRFMDCGVSDYNAPILKADLALSHSQFKSLWTTVLSLLPDFDVIDLKKIAGSVLGAVNPLTYLDCRLAGEGGHSLRLNGPGDPSGNLRRKLDREYRKISERGAVKFIVNPTGNVSELVMEKLFALKRRKYVQTNIPDFLAMPGVADFYRSVVSTKWLGKLGHLSALLVDDTIISGHVGYVGRGNFYYIMPAYDAEYARYRPGHLLLRELIDQSKQQGDETFDFGVGDEPYKQMWANNRLPLYDYEQAITAAGRAYLKMRRVRRFLKSNSVRTWFQRTG